MNTSFTAETTSEITVRLLDAVARKNSALVQQRSERLQLLLEKAKSFKDRGLIRQPQFVDVNRDDFYRLYAE